ncbi:MAG: FAD-dependent oxidoreductase [Firmicutes bacterium]|nr:FAD-dependent oxidoreductase [Bacillota bacterium]
MITVSNVRVPPDYDFTDLRDVCASALNVGSEQITECRLLRRSVDARKKSDVHFVCTFAAALSCDENRVIRRIKNTAKYQQPQMHTVTPNRDRTLPRPVVIGFGPGGMFAALTLAEHGYRPIVLERGNAVEQRVADVNNFWNNHLLNTESNVQFGEGGAGTFSDGKLNTGTKDCRQRTVLETFVKYGAPQSILYSAKPHIGTDNLVAVVRGIRERINELGGQVKFGCKVCAFDIADAKLRSVTYESAGERYTIDCDAAVLAIGHSARDTFRLLHDLGVPMEQKPFAVGARIEHSQQFIDRLQYGRFAGLPQLGAADYRVSAHLQDSRGVFSFCMCPGGTVVAAASEEQTVVTNGMSNSARDGDNANSALLVNVSAADFGSDHVLAGVEYQRKIERAAYRLTGGYRAPAQTAEDFLRGAVSSHFGAVRPTFTAGVAPADLAGCLPSRVCDGLKFGIARFTETMPGFDREAVLTGPETRSSSPVRILRGDRCMSPIAGLYPCGEGAGYAGGIMSAAVDGIRCAENLML